MLWAEMRASAWKYGALALAVLAVAAIAACAYFRSAAAVSDLRAAAAGERAQSLSAQLREVTAAREAEYAKAAELAAVAEQYEQDKADAQATHDRVVSDLRAGSVRLRQHWQGCQARLSGVAAGPGQPDDAEQRRSQGAGDLVRLAAEWDAKERALQAVVRADRKP